MKKIKVLALIALALTLGLTGCKKDNEKDNSSQLYETRWRAESTIPGEDFDTEIYYTLDFGNDGKFQLNEDHDKYVKVLASPDESALYQKSGTFTLIGSTLTLTVTDIIQPVLEEPKSEAVKSEEIAPYATSIIEGTYSDGKMSLKIYGQDVPFFKITKIIK
ncbi:MAG: hypothetical protein J6T02_01625 [Bacteroidales bacterium]|nr:hypothetical protein [Bacteroidales bacterium]